MHEAVKIRAMKENLIRFCLIAGLTWCVSCTITKEGTGPQELAPEPTIQPTSPPPTSTIDIRLPDTTQESLPQEENTESAPGPTVLPGDFRPGLRTPRLPDTLLYDPDGKLITPEAS